MIRTGTKYVLEYSDPTDEENQGIWYDTSSDLDSIREAILLRTEFGQITDANKGMWLVYAIDFPSNERRSLSVEEKARLFP